MSRRRWAVLAAVAAGLAALGVLNFVLLDDPPPRSTVERCEPGDVDCFEARYVRVVRESGPERALRAFKADYRRDPAVRAKCHGLTHAIGAAAGRRFGDVAEAYRHGDRFCASGYYHGALETIVAGPDRASALGRPDEVCSGLSPRSTDALNCSHGLGHGFMSVRSNDVPASLGLCDRLSAGYARRNCYDGVFMENVMAANDSGSASRYLDPAQPMRLCAQLAARYRDSCLKRQVLYALDVTRGNFGAIFGLCRRFGAAERAPCDRQLGEAAADLNIASQPSAAAQAGATAQLCGLAPDALGQQHCAEGATGYFVFHFARAAEAKAFCRLLGALSRPCARTADRHLRALRSSGPGS